MRTALAPILLLAACATPRATEVDPRDRIVVLVSVDGLAWDYLDDPKAHMPTLRRLAREGARAEGTRSVFPTVTWPNHTTIVTGVAPARHGVLGNSYWDRAAGKVVPLIPDPLFDKDEIVKAPTLYDVAHAAGRTTAAVIWPASRNARTLTWTVPDVKPNDLFLKYGTPAWLDELRAEGIWVDMQETWCSRPGGGVQRDWMYARMACQLLRRHRPNLLLLHLVELDHVEHQAGPRTPDAYWACSYVDDRLRDLVETIEAEGLRDRATLIVTSDHGFVGYTKTIHPNVAIKKAGLAPDDGPKRAWVVAQGGGAFVYVLDREKRAETLARAKDVLGSLEGVELIEEKDFAAHGLSTPDRDPRWPDLALSARDGYSFSDAAGGDKVVVEGPLKGSHGALPAEPKMRGTFVAWGAGIRPGARLPAIGLVDVAPTAARLLGLRMDGVEGRVLEEALR